MHLLMRASSPTLCATSFNICANSSQSRLPPHEAASWLHVLVASLYLAVLHRAKQQTPTTIKEGLASVRWFLGLGCRPLIQTGALGVCRGLHARLRGSGAVRIMRDGVILPTVVQLAGESPLCHVHALCLNDVTRLHNLVNVGSDMLLLCCTAFDSLAAFSARRGNTTAGQHPASQCRHQHTISITACISDVAPTFQALHVLQHEWYCTMQAFPGCFVLSGGMQGSV